MPGLFGILPLTCNGHEDLFEEMGAALCHSSGHAIDRWSDPESGVLIGRVGRPRTNALPWGGGASNLSPFFVAGWADTNSLHASPTREDVRITLRRMSGFFAVAIPTPGRNAETILAVDRRASIPIFYAHTAACLVFASEVKAVLRCTNVARQVDPAALATFFASGHLYGDQTLLSSVRRLRGGEFLRVGGGTVCRESYWRFSPGAAVGRDTEPELAAELGRLVGAAAAKHLGDPARTMLFLSGGADSRGILGGALAAVGGAAGRLNTVSWGASEGPVDSDVAVARTVAAGCGVNHRFIRREVSDFTADFTRTNALIDGLSEMAALNPHEFGIMEHLATEGFTRVLRGDEAFGWSYHARDLGAALNLVRIRRLSDGGWIRALIHPGRLEELAAASDDTVAKVADEGRDRHPDDAKDYFYFTHRLQGFLNTASYWKQDVLDQRNVLLDEPILDFMERVPPRLRVDKCLYRRAMTRTYPALWEYPMAKRDNLESWRRLIVSDTSVRAHIVRELEDTSSAVWNFLDRRAWLAALSAIDVSESSSPVGTWRPRVRGVARRLYGALPMWAKSAVESHRARRPGYYVSPERMLLRFAAIKHWCDIHRIS